MSENGRAPHDSVSLAGKRVLITGVLTKKSIAHAACQRVQHDGAEVILTTFDRVRRLTERAAKSLPHPAEILDLDVTREEDFARLRQDLEERWGRVDCVLHAVAYAPPDAIGGTFMSTPAESALAAFRASAYSYKALAESLAPLMTGGGSIVGLDFDAERAWPDYDWMGVSKAALESVNRYVARDLGPSGVRCNLIAAGPLRTPAAGGFPQLQKLTDEWVERAPLGWDDRDRTPVADVIAFLFSDAARAITGEIIHVDGGFHAVEA